MMTQCRILIIAHDVVEKNMAGPAIRCWEMAQALSAEAHVTLASPHPSSLSPDQFALVQYDAEQLEILAGQSDVIILSGHSLWRYPFLRDSHAALVVDIYDPFLLESLPLLSNQTGDERDRRHAEVLDALTDLMVWGDFFICSSEKQRDYWLGWLNAVDRINPATYDDDPTLRRLIDVVAFGLSDTLPQHSQAVLKGVRPGIAVTDYVLVWGGGVYNWFDPLTLLHAMKRVAAQRQDVKLIFLGINIPDPSFDCRQMAERTLALSRELGLYEKTVFFNEWTPYQDRQNYLIESDVGVSLHFAHLETEFAYRTRLLDYIWAGLPMLVTRGDVLSDQVQQRNLGWVVDYEDVDGVTGAILESLSTSRGDYQARFDVWAQQLTWSHVLKPVLAFCRAPRPAPDRRRARTDLQALPGLKLISQVNALRRDLDARVNRMARLDDMLREREASLADLQRVGLVKDMEIAQLHSQVDILKLQLDQTQQRAAAEQAHYQAETERLQTILEQVRQGRVMRLLDGFNHMVKGSPLE